ncbi:MAG: AAA family ATPase [Candidatus Odinarchaeia archaeon]
MMSELDVEQFIAEFQKKYKIIGREQEIKKALLAKKAGRHLLFEGEVGVGKTVLASAIAQFSNQPIFRVDGDERFNESKLVGFFDPPAVVAKGYSWESFIPGPLTSAMKEGGILFLNELNRLPEGTQNILLPAMDENRIYIPKLGEVKAREGFYIIATQNPEEHIGVTALGEALRDRFVWLRMGYQSEEEEREITKLNSGLDDDEIVSKIVKIVRLTRKHPDLRRGSSVRAAIDMAKIIKQYGKTDLNTFIEVAIMALATKVDREEGVDKPVEKIITEIVKLALKDFR